ncbi:MAG: J domain-containing protein [Desulfuromonadales bacterium]|nr:J domain-containing protein [Desulfuromonadales bacterium]
MMTYRDLQESLQLFGLGERATLRQIKARHRELVKAHHPDRQPQADDDRIRQINRAYALLRDYCENYRFCFSEEEFLEQQPAERLRRQFGWDPVWSGSADPKD